jgi:hypothetical protein
MLTKGVPAATVAERLGHANAGITLGIYAHALKTDKHAAAAIWDGEMGHVVQEVVQEATWHEGSAALKTRTKGLLSFWLARESHSLRRGTFRLAPVDFSTAHNSIRTVSGVSCSPLKLGMKID